MQSDSCEPLRVGKSTIDEAGEGVFVTRDVKAGEVLCEYLGEIVTKDKPYDHNVAYETVTGVIILGNAVASKINDNVHLRKMTYSETENFFKNKIVLRYAHEHNCAYCDESTEGVPKVLIKATKDISSDDELFIDYGINYWVFEYLKRSLIDYSFPVSSIRF